jgi:hypothetical protein
MPVLEFSGIAWVCAGIMTLVLRLRITLSALPLRMDMLSVGINVCLVPKADMPV